MMYGYKPFVPVDETVTPLSTEERADKIRQYRVLEQIIEAARLSDAETVKALAATL